MLYLDVFLTFLRLGLTSFGGPVAHLSYFHHEFVDRKKWIKPHDYADLVALCQFLPGPASSQVGMGLGLNRAGIPGAILAWIGFTFPSAIILTLFALGISSLDLTRHQDWLHGLKVAAVSVVAQAVYGMGVKLCPDLKRKTIALIACAIVLSLSFALTQILVIVLAGLLGILMFKSTAELPHTPILQKTKKKTAVIFLIIFGLILVLLPLAQSAFPGHSLLKAMDSFYRTGALVFGGGHVVLPLLQSEIVSTGWVSKEVFMAGYGLAQIIPGPLFAFSSFLGAAGNFSFNPVFTALVCLIATFLPSFLLVVGSLPFWEKFRGIASMRKAMMGINAAVVGILLAALYQPVWISAIFNVKDFVIAAVGFLLLEFAKLPSWAVVILAVLASIIIY